MSVNGCMQTRCNVSRFYLFHNFAEEEKKKAFSAEHIRGVGVKVSFGGREFQPLNLLSGGQQSVVALALIFAIQRCDPSPFYIFDEIDQALDPYYRNAVANLIAKQSKTTQFLTTTFGSEQVNVGDKFYGVSFDQRTKVSKIKPITKEEALALMKLIEKEEAARRQREADDSFDSEDSGFGLGLMPGSQPIPSSARSELKSSAPDESLYDAEDEEKEADKENRGGEEEEEEAAGKKKKGKGKAGKEKGKGRKKKGEESEDVAEMDTEE